MGEDDTTFQMVGAFLCLGSFILMMGIPVILGALYQKSRKGYYFYNDNAFSSFWELYASEPSVALRNIDSTSRGGTWTSYKIRWMRLNVYINKIGIFYYYPQRYDQTYGALLLFNEDDLEKYDSRYQMPLHSYEFVDENVLILHCQRPTPFGQGKGRLVLKGISPQDRENIQCILHDHFDSLKTV